MRSEKAAYLTVPEVLEIHAQVMESMNSNAAPLRSMDRLESAVMRPQAVAVAVAHDGSVDLAE